MAKTCFNFNAVEIFSNAVEIKVLAIQKEAANMMIEQFSQHKQRLDTMQQNVYSNMHKAGVPIKAIQQKADLEGVVWNPMSREGANEL